MELASALTRFGSNRQEGMGDRRHARVLVIGLDAAEPMLVERWGREGFLPSLQRLRSRGSYGRLSSPAVWLSGSPWPTFYTGTSPAEHGHYSYMGWWPERMAIARPTAARAPLEPFWRAFGPGGPRAVALDIPKVYAPPPFDGVEISGWGTHEVLVPPCSHPRRLLARTRRRFGPSPRTDEVDGLEPVERLLATGREQCRLTERVTDVALALMAEERWDVFLVCLAATHRAGHKLWSATAARETDAEERRDEIARALRSVYRAVDAAVGRLVEAAGEDVTTLTFSLHGMGHNTSRVDVLPGMLRRVLRSAGAGGGAPVEGRVADRSPLGLLRAVVPPAWRRGAKRRLPLALQDRLTAWLRTRTIDWSRTPAFALVGDLQGYIRLNVRGREARGIVEPGRDVDALCDRIAEGLSTFVDADTGEPVVAGVARRDEVLSDGPRADLLPDLIVRWSPTAAAAHRAIVSPRHGEIRWPTPGRDPSGRSGNHRGEGFLIAAGGPFPAGGRLIGGRVEDLAPTIHGLLGTGTPVAMHGRDLAERAVAAAAG